jgi:hypothetical protein
VCSSDLIHPERIARRCPERLKPIAYGHDLLEDTSVTMERLIQEGFPEYILIAIDLLTRRASDTNEVYWMKILTNPDAAQVKILDIDDNINDCPTESGREKYTKAIALFKQYGYTA